jgi:hypothetical protein
MARETGYFVQAFNAGRGGSLKADAPIACKTATGALRTAERLALSKLGVLPFHPPAMRRRAITITSRWSLLARESCRRASIEMRRIGRDGIASAMLPQSRCGLVSSKASAAARALVSTAF